MRSLCFVFFLVLYLCCSRRSILKDMTEGNFSHVRDDEVKQEIEFIFSSRSDNLTWTYGDLNNDGNEDLILREKSDRMCRERVLGIFSLEKETVVTILWDVVDMTCFYELCDSGVLYYEQYYGVYDNEKYTLFHFDEHWNMVIVEGLELICFEDVSELSFIQMPILEKLTEGEINCLKYSEINGVMQYTKITKEEWLEEYRLLFGKEYSGQSI